MQTNIPETGAECKCGLLSVLRQVTKESANQGRYFYTCPKIQSQGPCKYFVWADGMKSKEPSSFNTTPPPALPPQKRDQAELLKLQPPHKKLKRSYAVADLSPIITTPLSAGAKSGMVQDWNSKMTILSSANSQMLTKAIEQNTMAVDRLNLMIEALIQSKTIPQTKNQTHNSPDDDSSTSSSQETPRVENPSCQK
jgi:hypothetical protein